MTDKLLSGITRRQLLIALPALTIATGLLAQTGNAPIPVRKLHSFGLKVSDVARSVRFYQDMFAAPVQARHGETVLLRIGTGPYFFSLSPTTGDEQPHISYIGISVPGFDLLRVQRQLESHGIMPGAVPVAGESALAIANRSWIKTRTAASGGDVGGTRELFFTDRDGLVYQLNDPAYCGGNGPLGLSCNSPEPADSAGLMKLVELSHFTNRVFNSAVSNQFHRNLFGLDFQASQGPGAPVIGVGDGIQFLMYIGGAGDGAPIRDGVIDHVCLGVEDFNVDQILSRLTDYGLSARQDPANTPPLVHYISMRMPNRGGAEGGTPELYFSDPDGIRIQLQDPSYCGGGGYLGDDCSAPV